MEQPRNEDSNGRNNHQHEYDLSYLGKNAIRIVIFSINYI